MRAALLALTLVACAHAPKRYSEMYGCELPPVIHGESLQLACAEIAEAPGALACAYLGHGPDDQLCVEVYVAEQCGKVWRRATTVCGADVFYIPPGAVRPVPVQPGRELI